MTSSSSSELLMPLRLLPFIRTGPRWPSERADGEKEEGEEEELEAVVGGY